MLMAFPVFFLFFGPFPFLFPSFSSLCSLFSLFLLLCAGVGSLFIGPRERGSLLLCIGSRTAPGWLLGAAGKARRPWFLIIKVHGASGFYRSMQGGNKWERQQFLSSPVARPGEEERGTVSPKRHCSVLIFLFIIIIYIYILLLLFFYYYFYFCVGTQK